MDYNIIKRLIDFKITPNEYYLLFFLYHKDFDSCEKIFGKKLAIEIKNQLENTKYILSSKTKFQETVLSKNNVELLLNIKANKNINFWEFYTHYPIRVGSRVLRAAGPTTAIALKHQEKYLKRVKTVEQHELAIESIRAFVAKQKQANKLSFLPGMEVVMNNSMWEQWVVFIQEVGTEEQEWNNDTI